MHVSLKGTASFSICVCSPITWDPTLINKVRTREFTREIIAEEIQQIFRMNMTSNHESTTKNTWQHNHYNKQPNSTRLTQIRHQGNLTWNRARQTIAGEIQPSCRMEKWQASMRVQWKNTWQHNHYNKQPNHTRLTQIRHHGKLTWNRALQTIPREIQVSCRMKNDKQAWEYN
jgi:hypothetical protein